MNTSHGFKFHPSIRFTGLYRSLLFFNAIFLCKFTKMINKKFLDFPQITVKETLQLSKKDFKNAKQIDTDYLHFT